MTHRGASTQWLLPLLAATLLAACSSFQSRSPQTDALNEKACSWRYRNVDSLGHYAKLALESSPDNYPAGRAEALNHLALERIQRLDFDSALALTRAVQAIDGTPIEHAIADIIAMKVAQRTSDNVAFFIHRAHATQQLGRIAAKAASDHDARRLNFAHGEIHIVASTYFYYVDQLDRAREEIAAAEPFCKMQEDTAQWLNYCYMYGSGGLVDSPDPQDVTRREFDYLFTCFTFSKNRGYLYFEANALQSLATLLDDSIHVATLQTYKPEALIYLDILFPKPTPTTMAAEAVELFRRFDDPFQTACALRTKGTLAASEERYDDAINSYNDALTLVDEAHVPEWEAGIWEKMSVALAGEGDLEGSAMARNRYLDLRDHTREDAEWTSRAELLRAENARLRHRIIATVVLAIVLAVMILLMRRWWLRRNADRLQRATECHQRLLAEAEARTNALSDAEELLREEREATLLRIQRYKRQNIVQRAKLNLAREIIPLLDRIIHAARRMMRQGQPNTEALNYICELTERIDENGQLLTDWIQMERGRVSLSISTFGLEPLLATLRRSAFAFRQRGITLNVEPTPFSVKADRALTLFMLNTLADNARKATPEGGSVTISASDGSNADGSYVELSVSDTGCGLTGEQQAAILSGRTELSDGHGFGLLNCRGIIERYRKTSRHFAVAAMGVESKVGEGSRFWFRLPKAAATLAMLCIVLLASAQYSVNQTPSPLPIKGESGHLLTADEEGEDAGARLQRDPQQVYTTPPPPTGGSQMGAGAGGEASQLSTSNFQLSTSNFQLSTSLTQAYRLADSLYYANVDGRNDEALFFAAGAIAAVNAWHAQLMGHTSADADTLGEMSLFPVSGEAADVQWLLRGDSIDFNLLLGIRNEAAVAALATRQWDIYTYNNHVYTRLYKLCNHDTTLEADCLRLEQAQRGQRLTLWLMLALIIVAAILSYVFWLRPRMLLRRTLEELRCQRFENDLAEKRRREALQQTDVEQAEDEHRRRLFEESRLHVQNQIMDNCLSTIKHETLYYPSRIRHLAQQALDAANDDAAVLTTLTETATYCREVYATFIAQGEQQATQLPFRISNVERSGQRIQADAELLDMLLATLQAYERQSTTEAVVAAQPDADPRFVRFTIANPDTYLTEAQCIDLFAPHANGFDLLVAKQILRELDTLLGHVGCRIEAEPTPDARGHVIWFTLPKAIHNS